jgi:hypothetical protein
MKNFDPNKLRDYLNARKGCTFATMWAITAPKMNKTENPYFDRVVHRWSKNVTFGANYSRSVNRKWEKTDTDELFIAEALGERDPRNRRETQERASDNTLARSGNLRLDQLGRMEVDVEALADELERRGFTKGGSGG